MRDIDLAASECIDTTSKVLLSKKVYEDGWNEKEIIAHIVFYHGYYSRVVKAIVEKKELPLSNESLAKVNLESAEEYSKLSREKLLQRFKASHKVLMNNISKLDKSTIIPYKAGGSVYTPETYIDVIAGHIMKHTKDLKRRSH